MRDVMVELKQLRLHGMAGAWADLAEQGGDAGLDNARWLVEHLLQAEGVDRGMRPVKHQMHGAKFPFHRDLAGFDFDVSPVHRKRVMKPPEMGLVDQSPNGLVGGGPRGRKRGGPWRIDCVGGTGITVTK